MAQKFIQIAICLIILIIGATNVARFWKLDSVPYGYHVDEMASAVTLQCMDQYSSDAEMHHWPLYGQIQYGTDKPPAYLYLGKIWVKLFGTTVGSLRGFSCAVLLLGFLGLYLLARRLHGPTAALFTVLAATCSPWSWVISRIAFESFFAPVFIIWGLYFIFRSVRWWDWVIAAFMFVMAMYSYPPARLYVPLMLGMLFMILYIKKQFSFKSLIYFTVSSVIFLIPLIHLYLEGVMQRRFQEISIFNPAYLQQLGKTASFADTAAIFIQNYMLHLSSDFLFLTGDPSYVHSTRHLGLFSYLDVLAIVIAAGFLVLMVGRIKGVENPWVTEGAWLLFLVLNFLISIIPSALTNQELPHSLRICGSWPFMMIFTGLLLDYACRLYKICWVPVLLAGLLSSYLLVYQYFYLYPQESKGMFNFWVSEQVNQIKTDEDMKQFLVMNYHKNYHERYFLVQKYKMTCREANDFWWNLYRQLEQKQ